MVARINSDAIWREWREMAEAHPREFENRSRYPGAEYVAHNLKVLLELPTNWDSHGAPRIKAEQAIRAVELLDATMRPGAPWPSIVPTSRGGIQIEWHAEGIDFEIATLPASKFVVYFFEESTGNEWELEIDSDWSAVDNVLADMARRRKSRVASRGR